MIETGDIQVIIEDGTNANLCQQIAYIKAGKTEIEEAVQEGIGDFNTNATEKTNTFNSNASAKTLAFNQNADAKTLIYDNNASDKLTAYNENATNKLADFNTNATNKTTAFDLNATNKTTAFNNNASEKTSTFNDNAIAKTSGFNSNATSKTNDFNSNAGSKTDAFNDNYQDKKALIDAEVQTAKDWATKTDGTVDGVDYSAKYYAQSILPIKDDITAVAEIATDVSDVAEIKDEVTAVAQDKENVDAVAENITNVNTVAGDHANIQTVVNNMTAINNAPTYANKSKIWAEGLDGEVAPLGGTHSSKGWAQIAEAAASGVQNPANRDLSNLTNTGQMVIDSQNGTISNCILEIPQNIKLEFSNGTVTLKAGSTIVLSGSTYQTLTTTQDTSWTNATFSNSKGMLFVSASGNAQTLWGRYNINKIGSGSSLPADGSTYSIFFNTTDKLIYLWGGESWEATTNAYPLGVVEIDSQGAITGFAKDSNGNDMIFNGIGFIGHHTFVYPNISVLLPNNFNEDGSLKSIKYTTNSLYINEIASNRPYYYLSTNGFGKLSGYYEFKKPEDVTNPQTYTLYYFSDGNYSAYYSSGSFIPVERCFVFEAHLSGTTVTDFTIRQPYEGARNLLTITDDDNTFTGKNTFLQNPVVEGTNQFYEIKDDNIAKGTIPSQYERDSFIQVVDVSEHPLAACFYRVDTSGNAYTALVSYKFENNSNDNAQIGIWYKADGTSYATCPTPTEDTNNSTQIDTVGARNTKLASLFTSITGYDSTKTQTLKNVNGTLTWVDD